MSREISFICNQKKIKTPLHPATTVLDFLRREQKLTGTKEGCREGDCGACTVLVGDLIDGEVVYNSFNSCLLPIHSLNGKHLVTIEGLNSDEHSPIKQSFLDEGGTQCGFCTPGFIISFTGYFLTNNNFKIDDGIESIAGNICRCTGHTSIIRALKKSLGFLINQLHNKDNKLAVLIDLNVIPNYFLEIPQQLKQIKFETKENQNGILISGGTDLFVQKWDELLKYDNFFFLQKSEKEKIRIEENKIYIHSTSTVSDIINSTVIQKYFPEINYFLKLFGSLQIRNRATIGGNIINASPIGDLTNILLALNSSVLLSNENEKREVELKNFYSGYKKFDKKENEIIEAIYFSAPKENSFFNFEKVSRRKHLDIATVNSSIYLETNNSFIKEIHLSAGGVFPYPFYLESTCEFLQNKEITTDTVFEATKIADIEIAPISDVRGSEDYKRLLLRQLIFAHFIKFFPQLINVEVII